MIWHEAELTVVEYLLNIPQNASSRRKWLFAKRAFYSHTISAELDKNLIPLKEVLKILGTFYSDSLPFFARSKISNFTNVNI